MEIYIWSIFNKYAPKESIYLKHGINNILFLDKSLNKNVKLNINNNIKNLLELKNNISIKEIKKIEYGIYTY